MMNGGDIVGRASSPKSSTEEDSSATSVYGLQNSNGSNIPRPPSSISNGGSGKTERPKYTRLLQSCDSCRARKVRCVQVDSTDPEKDGIGMTLGPNGTKQMPYCKPCIAASINCTYHFKAKKRGPPNQHVRRLRAAAAAAAATVGGENNPGSGVGGAFDPTNAMVPGSGTLTLDPKPPLSSTPVQGITSPTLLTHPQHRNSLNTSTPPLINGNPGIQSTTANGGGPTSPNDVSVSPITMLMARSGVIGPDWNLESVLPPHHHLPHHPHDLQHHQHRNARMNSGGIVSVGSGGAGLSPPGAVTTSPTLFTTHGVPANDLPSSAGGGGTAAGAGAGAISSPTAYRSPPRPLTTTTTTTGAATSSAPNTASSYISQTPTATADPIVNPALTSPASSASNQLKMYPSHYSNVTYPYAASASSRTTLTTSPLTPNAPVPSSPAGTQPYCLNNYAPTSTILHILSLFFDFVWPLTPCIHRPSFYADLGEKREERDPLFFALVCSTLASTLVQVPRSYLPMDRDDVRSLARRFSEASKKASLFAHDPPSSTMVVIKYFDNIYYFREGKEGSSTSAYGEALYMATCLRMHNEDSYEGLDYIEREVRRRAFWLLFGADKSICAISHRPCSLRLEDCTVRLPTEVDDEYITARAILPQPPNKTPLISGFNFISRVFSLIAEIISIVRRDVHKPPSDATAVARLEEVCEIHRRILNVFNDVPTELRLRNTSARRAALGHGSGSQPAFPLLDLDAGGFAADFDGAGFTQAAIAEVNQLFDNPNANREDAGNAFLVMQANIYVTQHMARLMAEQHRHQLVASLRVAGYDLSLVHSPVVAAEIARGGWTAEDREAVARDLLQVLHTIPILSIATNGPSLVHKVRFVASTLLDSIREADTAPKPAARALNYLWDFLAILSEIERNYSLGEEIPPPQPMDASL